ncbi:MAG: hypothetical protein K8T10_12335 [Candidatus Eremiobacteraeota bacterium]|nr:hypothetical protein [Candidatus Eremiobacteraeota bacterium]
MKIRVHLLEDIKNNGKCHKFSLGKFFENLKLKCEIFYWGLHPALAGESIVHVRLNGRGTHDNAPGYDYELDFFDYNYLTKFDIFLGKMKTKLVATGMGLLALSAFIGVSADKAEAIQKNSITPPPPVESLKSQTSVIPSAMEVISNEVLRMNENNEAPFRLARYHNNIPGYHTNAVHENVDWQNWDNHGNVDWADGSREHANEWTNTPHSNSPPVEHTNVSSGDIPGDYIY